MIIYFDLLEKTRKLNNEQFGILMRAIIAYCDSGCETHPEFDDPVIDMAFDMLAPNCKNDLEKWDEIRQKRSEAGKKGGAPIGNQNASKNKQNNQKQTKQPVTVTGTVNVNVNDNVNVTDINSVIEKENNNFKGKQDYSMPVNGMEVLKGNAEKVLNRFKEKARYNSKFNYLPSWAKQDLGLEQESFNSAISYLLSQGLIKKEIGKTINGNDCSYYFLPGEPYVERPMSVIYLNPDEPDMKNGCTASYRTFYNTIKGFKLYWNSSITPEENIKANNDRLVQLYNKSIPQNTITLNNFGKMVLGLIVNGKYSNQAIAA